MSKFSESPAATWIAKFVGPPTANNLTPHLPSAGGYWSDCTSIIPSFGFGSWENCARAVRELSQLMSTWHFSRVWVQQSVTSLMQSAGWYTVLVKLAKLGNVTTQVGGILNLVLAWRTWWKIFFRLLAIRYFWGQRVEIYINVWLYGA